MYRAGMEVSWGSDRVWRNTHSLSISTHAPSHGMVSIRHMHVISIHTAPHLAKSLPISHIVNIIPTRDNSAARTRPIYVVRANPKDFSHVLLLTGITSTAAAKHMHKVLLMQVCIEQNQSGDGKASVKPPWAP